MRKQTNSTTHNQPTTTHTRNVRIGIILPEDQRNTTTLHIPDHPYFLNDTPIRNTTITVTAGNQAVSAADQTVSAGDQTVSAEDQAVSAGDQNVTIRHSDSEHTCNRCVLRPENSDPTTGISIQHIQAGRGFHFATSIDVVLPDAIEISNERGWLMLINELPRETYLKGVITAEMSSACPIEFLKAQCVTARSWMLAASEHKHANLGIDYCNDDCCQRYQGIEHLSESAVKAVDQTASLILIHSSGCVVDANYAKCCGGITESPEHVWSVPKPGQHSVVDAPPESHIHNLASANPNSSTEFIRRAWLTRADAFCSAKYVSPTDVPRYLGRIDDGQSWFRWTKEIAATDLLANLKHHISDFHDAHQLTDIRIASRGDSGRATSVEIDVTTSSMNATTLTIHDQYNIRQALHPDFLFSTAITLSRRHDAGGAISNVIYHGAGWGHGAGLCQIGALGMSLAGYDHEQILKHYFTNVTINRSDRA